MDRTNRLFISAVAAMLTASALIVPPAETHASTGLHRACKDHVAIRKDRGHYPARDNLDKGQAFMVTLDDGGQYVYGYKVVNDVHGWVLRSSIGTHC